MVRRTLDRGTPLLVFAVAMTALSVGCGGSGTPSPAASGSADTSGTVPTGEITVLAAASLAPAFTDLGARFESAHPGTSVRFSFAGSSDLVTQLAAGAPADVFAAADHATMTRAVEAGVVSSDPVDFATNTLVIVTAPGNPKNISSLADLEDPDVLTVMCAAQVPCGAATEKVERIADVDIPAVSEESSVTDVLGKVTSGQSDAGLVYVTDASAAADSVTEIPFAESAEAVNTYPIAEISGSSEQTTARAFIDLVTGPQGRQVLAAAGFAAP